MVKDQAKRMPRNQNLTKLNLQVPLTNQTENNAQIPHIIKYMGSKKPILNFINDAIERTHLPGNWVCDLFAGSCSISAGLRRKYDFISNDIQDYSRILAHTYFSDLSHYDFDELFEQIELSIKNHYLQFKDQYGEYFFDYSKIKTLEHFAEIELKQRDLLKNEDFKIEDEYFLFVKFYSGTYWSFEQCVWIDSLRKMAEEFKDNQIYYPIMSSIMYAMSYSTQSTGHFAQYRDGGTLDAMNNIIFYRLKDFYELFIKKFKELLLGLKNSLKQLNTTTLSFEECLRQIPANSTVYADPPYAPVHYSRFYHALETLVKYDYPTIDFKGRYRNDRHQSPFSKKSDAKDAFRLLFEGIIKKDAQMVLSYSGSGVLDIGVIIELAVISFPERYKIEIDTIDHKHSTMGRFDDSERDVVEYLIIAKFI